MFHCKGIAIIALLSMLVFAHPSYSQGADFSKCHAISGSTERLQCYDEQTSFSLPKNVVDSDVVEFGKWRKQVEISNLTDDRNVYFRLQSINEVIHQYPHQRNTGRASIIARCLENRTAFIVRMDDKFLSDNGNFGQIEYRIDSQSMKRKRFAESTSNKALGLWRGSGIPFLKEMIGSQKLVLRITPFNESPQEMKFDIAGIDNVVSDIRAQCNW